VTAPNSKFVPTNGIRVGERLKGDFKEGLVGEQHGREGVLRWFGAVVGQAAVGLWVRVRTVWPYWDSSSHWHATLPLPRFPHRDDCWRLL